VLEIVDAFAADYGPLAAGDLVAYFRAYERAGVMTVAELPAPPDRRR
jgi:hypothetical protein